MTDVTRTGARSIPPTSIALATAAPSAISPLQQRMIDDMRLRHFGAKTQQSYIRRSRTSRPSWADRPPRRRQRICGATNCT